MDLVNTEEYRWEGYWWLPGTKEEHPGTLEYSPDSGFTLRLLSEGFESPYVELDLSPKRIQGGGGSVLGHREAFYNAIYGAANGRYMTVFDVRIEGSSRKVGAQAPFAEARYHAHSALLGAHVAGLTEACVVGVSVAIENLHRWLGPPPRLNIYSQKFNRGRDQDKTIIEFPHTIAPGPRRGAQLAEGTVVTFSWNATSSGLKWSSRSYEGRITESAMVDFDPQEPWTLNDAHHYSQTMARLISLGLDKICPIFAIDVILNTGSHPQTAHYLTRRGVGDYDETFVHRHEAYIFRLEDVDVESLIPAWFDFHEQHQSSLGLLYTMHAGTTEHLETSVLLSAVLAEAFHKSYFGRGKSSISQCAVDLDKALFQRGNSKSRSVIFQERVLDLYCRAPKELVEKIIPDVETWSKGLVKARNDIAHEAGLQGNSYEKAIAIARVTIVLVTIHVLTSVGVPHAVIANNTPGTKLFQSAVFMTDKYLLQPDPGEKN